MTETEKKALALAIETRVDDRYRLCPDPTLTFGLWEAVCRAIEQHEAYKQEVSDAVESLCNTVLMSHGHREMREMLSRRFIVAKPDPLVEAMQDWWDTDGYASIETFRAAIEARGGRIVWEGDND